MLDLKFRTVASLTDCTKLSTRQSHKVFIGGLPQNVTEGELLKYFTKVAGPVADVLILRVRLPLP